MAISRILGASLVSNLDRQGVDLQFTTSGNALVYMDFADFRLGVNTATPNQALEVNGNILVANGHVISWANLSSNIGTVSNWFDTVHANTILSNNLYGTIQTADQPNITNVGALTSLTVVGDVNAGNLITSGTINTSGNLTVDNITANTITGVIQTSEQPLITTLANITVDSLATTGNISADYLVGNTVVSSNIYGVVLTETQPYISNLGNITVDSITIGGNVLITGNTSGGIINADEIYENGERVLTANTSFTVTGDVVGSGNYSNINLTLTNTGVTAGTYGDTTVVPSVTVDSQGRITLASNLTLTKVGNITVNDTTITSTGNLTLTPSTGIVDVGNSRLSNIAAPITSSDAVTVDYLNSVLSTTANNLTSGDSVLGLADTGTANLFLILDGNLVSSTTTESTTFLHPVNIGVLSFAGNTISSTTGNIQLDAQGTGIVQIVGADALGIPAGGISDRPGDPLIGYTRFNTDTNLIETWDGNSWSSPTTQTVTSEVITPDGVSNVFTLTSNASSAYGILVSINGTLQQPVAAYDVNGNQIVFNEIPQNTDIIEVRSIATGIVVTGLQRGETEVQLTTGNVNITGNLVPSANITYSLGSEQYQWKDLWVSGDTVYIGGTPVTITDGQLTVDGNIVGASDLYGNSNVASYLATYTGNVADLTVVGNLTVLGISTVVNTEIIEQDEIISGNITANNFNYANGMSILAPVESALSTLTANAGAQAESIANIYANLGSVSGSLSTLTANAGAQASAITDIQTNYANLSGATFTGNVTIPILTLSSALAVNQGGTGATTSADALNNLLPSGEQSGFVLKTSGPGTYFWASESGGGGGTVGQELTTLRQSNTATSGQTVFDLVNNITYTPGAGQLRVYVNGVRQHPDAYTETTANSYTLSQGVNAGTEVFAEIDAFGTFNNYANLTYASNIGNIAAVGLTVQSAIDALETTKAPLADPVFTGYVKIQNPLEVSQGGTGATTSADALNNLLPSGEQSGYVLKTSGAGSYYWSAESGGGGATVGQQLTTTRQANTATAGQSVFDLVSGINYTPGTGQLRVYVNGVRQYPSEYTETSNVSYTITGGVNSGDIVLAEIDQFSTFNNYANLTYASNVGNISAVGLTVQSAIENLETNKAPLANPVFTGNVTATNLIGAITSNQVTTALGTSSSIQFGSLGVGTAASGTTGEIRATNNITAYYSDERLKTRLGAIENALDKVDQLSGFYHEANELAQSLGYDRVREVGVSAQEVQAVMPEVVAPAPIDDQYLTVRYERLVPLLIEAVKELRQEVNDIKRTIEDK